MAKKTAARMHKLPPEGHPSFDHGAGRAPPRTSKEPEEHENQTREPQTTEDLSQNEPGAALPIDEAMTQSRLKEAASPRISEQNDSEEDTKTPSPQPSDNVTSKATSQSKDKTTAQTTIQTDMDDRVCKHVPQIAMRPLNDEDFYRNDAKEPINLKNLRDHFKHEGLLRHEHIHFILDRVSDILELEPNCVAVPVPAIICGDIHGQYYDLLKLFKLGGPVAENHYLFMGDYVDRGCFSIECLLYLLAIKINHPDRLYLLRGNHESKHLTQYFTFKLECMRKYDDTIYEAFLQVFRKLPPCGVVNRQFFCVHGGISPSLTRLTDLEAFDRDQEPNLKGLFCDLLWSDPLPNYDDELGDRVPPFTPNKVRGTSYHYSYKAVKTFLDANKLLCLVRGHEAQVAGYRMYQKHPDTAFPTVITIFSAPNYVDVYKNKAAILKYDGETLNIRQFTHTPHPYWLPKFMDCFTWSVPFICEKVLDLLIAIMDTVSSDELAIDYVLPEQEALQREDARKLKATKQKIQAISKISRVYALLRSESEAIVELKNLMKTTKLPAGTLSLGVEGIRRAITSYDAAYRADRENEHLPPKEYVALEQGSGTNVLEAISADEEALQPAPSFHLLTEDSPMVAVLDEPPLTAPAHIVGSASKEQGTNSSGIATEASSTTTSCSFLWNCFPSRTSTS